MNLTSSVGAGRYAPSPSGDLHLGNLRTALIAWLAARTSHRAFFMRIENLDRARDQGSADRQLEHLCALGIDWDADPLIQTDRIPAYGEVLATLAVAGLTYECYCTRREILEAPRAPHDPPGSYPGTCRHLTDAEREAARRQISPRNPAVRVRLTDAFTTVTVHDLVCGEVTAVVDDLVLMRGDGTYAYNLVSVVDDAHQGVDQVIRGDDLLSSTPRQVSLQRVLGLPTPQYAHVPLVLGPTGERLAKRDGAVTLPELRAKGMTDMGVLALIGHSLGLCDADEPVTPSDLRARFDLTRLRRKPWAWHPAL